MKYSVSLTVVWALPVSAFLAALCALVCMRGEVILSVCVLASLLFLLVDIFSPNVFVRARTR